MRVLHVAASLADEWGGPVTVLRNLMPFLRDLGVEPTVLATKGYRVGTGTPLDGDPAHLARTSSMARVWTAHSTELGSIVLDLVKNTDVVHIHELWHYPHWAAWRAARAAGTPTVVTPHGALDEWVLRQKGARKAVYAALFQRRALRDAKAVQALTPREAEAIARFGVPLGRIRVIPNGLPNALI